MASYHIFRRAHPWTHACWDDPSTWPVGWVPHSVVPYAVNGIVGPGNNWPTTELQSLAQNLQVYQAVGSPTLGEWLAVDRPQTPWKECWQYMGMANYTWGVNVPELGMGPNFIADMSILQGLWPPTLESCCNPPGNTLEDIHIYECICPQAGGAPGYPNTNGCCGFPQGHQFAINGNITGAGTSIWSYVVDNADFYTTSLNSPNVGDTFTMTMPPGNFTCLPCFRYLGTVSVSVPPLGTPGGGGVNVLPANTSWILMSGNPTITQTSNYNLVDDCGCIPDIGIGPDNPVLGEVPALQPGLHLWTLCLDCEEYPHNWIDQPESCCPLTKLRSYIYIAAWEPQHFFQVPGSTSWWVDTVSATSPVPDLWEMCSTRARYGAELFWQILGSPSIGETRRLYNPPYLGAVGMDGYVHNMNEAPLHQTICIKYVGMKQCAPMPFGIFDLVDGHPWIDVTCEHKWGTMSTDLGGGTSGIPEQFTRFPGPCCPPPVPDQEPIELLPPYNLIHATGTPIGGGVVVVDPPPCPPQDINSPYYTNAPEFCEGCLPGGYYQMHLDCQCCDIDLNPANPYVVQDKTIKIINNNLDRAINEAKIRGLIDENVPSSRVMKELEAAVLAIPKHYQEQSVEEGGPVEQKKKEFPKPPKWLRCKGCGGGFGVCVFGGCFSGWKWEWPI